jgi:hypothetical protein
MLSIVKGRVLSEEIFGDYFNLVLIAIYFILKFLVGKEIGNVWF